MGMEGFITSVVIDLVCIAILFGLGHVHGVFDGYKKGYNDAKSGKPYDEMFRDRW